MGRGGGWHPHLAYIRRGTPPPLFQHIEISLSLLLRPRADFPCLEFTPGLEFSTIASRRSVGVGTRIRLFPLLAWFGAQRKHRLYYKCIISSRHYTCGAT